MSEEERAWWDAQEQAALSALRSLVQRKPEDYSEEEKARAAEVTEEVGRRAAVAYRQDVPFKTVRWD